MKDLCCLAHSSFSDKATMKKTKVCEGSDYEKVNIRKGSRPVAGMHTVSFFFDKFFTLCLYVCVHLCMYWVLRRVFQRCGQAGG